jgi:hypothetical protein
MLFWPFQPKYPQTMIDPPRPKTPITSQVDSEADDQSDHRSVSSVHTSDLDSNFVTVPHASARKRNLSVRINVPSECELMI